MIRLIENQEKNYFLENGKRYFYFQNGGKAAVILDKCPHRGGPLSLGQSVEGRIQCPWHQEKINCKFLMGRSLPVIRILNQTFVLLPN
jgi:nitrite reductase/ring-hydroxylating ferredoxin subunit